MRFAATAFLPVTLGLLGSFTQISVTAQGPIVSLKQGSFQGNATGEIVKFLGMPFAAPPCVVFFCFLHVLSLITSRASRKALETYGSPPLNHHFHFGVSNKRLRSERLASSSHLGQRKFWVSTYLASFRSHLWSLKTVSFPSLHSSSALSLMAYLGLFINVVKPAQILAGKKLPVAFVGCLISSIDFDWTVH